MNDELLKELCKSAETLARHAANLQLACLEKNKNNIYWYADLVRFWAFAVLGDFFDIIKKEV